VALCEICALVDTLDGSAHASVHQMRGIQNDDAK
jgi:hypothetical protein